MNTEEWRDIPGYEGRYQASSLGRIRSLPNSRYKTVRLLAPGLKPPTGYLVVNLSVDGKAKTIMIQNLVLTTFVGPRPPGLVACHRNNIPSDNALSNLRWDTQQSNIDDKTRFDTQPVGSKNAMAKLSESQVAEIKAKLKDRKRGDIARVAREYGLNPVLVCKIAHNKRWKHVDV